MQDKLFGAIIEVNEHLLEKKNNATSKIFFFVFNTLRDLQTYLMDLSLLRRNDIENCSVTADVTIESIE